MLALRCSSSDAWLNVVLSNFDAFLVDHAACERKASATGLSFVVRYPDRPALIEPLVAFAREELEHFHQVVRIVLGRGLRLGPDTPDPYVTQLLKSCRSSRDERLLDRLLVSAVVEARGCERFGMIAQALPHGELKSFYAGITQSEARHHGLFVRLAREYFDAPVVDTRLDEILTHEAEIFGRLAPRPSVH